MTYRQELPKAVESVRAGVSSYEDEWESLSGNFTQIPNEVLRSPAIKPLGKLVYFGLLSYNMKGNGIVYPSQETLAAELGISVDSVKRGIKHLASLNLIEVAQREGIAGRHNVYRLRKVESSSQQLSSAQDAPFISADSHFESGSQHQEQHCSENMENIENNNIDVQVDDDAPESTDSDVVVVDSPSEDEMHGIVEAMTDIGIATKVAERLAEGFDEAYIQEKLTLLNGSVSVHNEAAWLVSAITGDYQPPIPANHSGNDTSSAPVPDIVAELRERSREHATKEQVDTRELMRELFGEDGNKQPESTKPQCKPVITPESEHRQPEPKTTHKWSKRQLREMRDLAMRDITDPDEVRKIVGEPELTVDLE